MENHEVFGVYFNVSQQILHSGQNGASLVKLGSSQLKFSYGVGIYLQLKAAKGCRGRSRSIPPPDGLKACYIAVELPENTLCGIWSPVGIAPHSNSQLKEKEIRELNEELKTLKRIQAKKDKVAALQDGGMDGGGGGACSESVAIG